MTTNESPFARNIELGVGMLPVLNHPSVVWEAANSAAWLLVNPSDEPTHHNPRRGSRYWTASGVPGRVSVEFSPGDSTRYVAALTLYTSEDAELWGGGRLIAAWPLLNVAIAVDHTGFHTADYVAEKLDPLGHRRNPCTVIAGRRHTCMVIAGFLTIVSAILGDPALHQNPETPETPFAVPSAPARP